MKKRFWLASLFIGTLAMSACTTSKQLPKTEGVKGIDKSGQLSTPAPKPITNDELTLNTVESKFLDKNAETTHIHLFVTAYKGKEPMTLQEFIDRYQLNYVVYADYGSRDRLGYGNVKLTNENTKRAGDQFVIEFDLKKPSNKESGVLLSELSEIGSMRKSLNDLPIRFHNTHPADRFGFHKDDILLNRNYIAANTPFQVKEYIGSQTPLYVSYYKHQFDPASSPMNVAPKGGGKPLVVDSTFQIVSNQTYQFTSEGLYYITPDTSSKEGISIRVTDDRYPKLTMPSMLKGPIQYMSTNQEIKDLAAADSVKKALDKYWLGLMNGNQQLAKDVIRSFYSRVEEANRLFTTYKEGWKTDKGMIFIVLGNPDKVQRSKDREVWVYNQKGNANNINFTFNKRNNQFVDDHYELVRYAEYQPIWYPIVEAWRTGAIR